MNRFFVLIAIGFVFLSASFTYADDYYEGKVISQYCKVYESANINSKVLRTLTKGVTVIITEERGEFYQIKVNANLGWSLKKDIEIFKDKLVITPNKQTDEPEEYEEPAVVNDDEPVVQIIPYYNNYKKLTYGLKGGLSMSKLTCKYFNSSDSKYRIGINIGGFMHYRFSEMVGFMAELNYVNRGGKGIDDNNQDVTVKFDYIELPILLRLDFGAAESPFVFGGLSLNYIINKALVTSEKTFIFDDVKKTDIGICLGAGYKFAFIEGNPIHIDFRYFQSLSTLHDASNAIDIKNTSILFNIGIDL